MNEKLIAKSLLAHAGRKYYMTYSGEGVCCNMGMGVYEICVLSNDDITYRDRLLQFAREQGLDWNYGIQDPYDRNRRLVPEKIYLQSMVCDVEHESSDDHPLPKARMDKYDRITRNFKLAFPDCEVLEGNEYGPGWQEFQLRCERAAGGKVLTKPRDVFEYGCII